MLFCHDLTRYMFILPDMRAPEFQTIERRHRELWAASLAAEGVEGSLIAMALSHLGPMRWDRNTDRSVLSSMRVAAQDVEFGVLVRAPYALTTDPVEVAQFLNRRPATVRGKWVHPSEDMKRLLTTVIAETE